MFLDKIFKKSLEFLAGPPPYVKNFFYLCVVFLSEHDILFARILLSN